MVTGGQLALLLVAILLFLVGGIVSLLRLGWDRDGLRISAKACMYFGVLATVGVLVWHAVVRKAGSWLPLEDNFEAFLWLAILLAAFVLYVQRTRSLAGLDWFVMPVVVVLLCAAAVLGHAARPWEYADNAFSWTHRVTTFGGCAAFAIAGAAGAVYLLTTWRLRSKASPIGPGPRLGSLEQLERITFSAVTLGFALLTIGLVTGFVHIARQGAGRLGAHWFAAPKVFLGVAVWVVYAIVLHAPITPRLRGRKVAMLSIAGCVLTVGTLVAVSLMPGMR